MRPPAPTTLQIVDIRIGILNSPREVAFESSQSADEVEKAISTAIEKGAPLVTFSDDKGKRYVIPTATIGYVEIGTDTARRVGFVG